jgi:FkbH-like protein
LTRETLRARATDDAAFIASLDVRCRFERPSGEGALARVEELFQRVTQFNTTGLRFSAAWLASGGADVFAMYVRDRFADHGLVGAAVVTGGEIAGFALSCRVIGLGVEQRFVEEIARDLAASRDEIVARIVATPRNGPARNLYRDTGFHLDADGFWRRALTRDSRAA